MKKLLILIFVLLVIIMPPILVNIGGNNLEIVSQGKFDNWLGFWGSYLGGIFGSLAVIITTYLIIRHEKKLSEKTFQERIKREEEVILKQDNLEKQRMLINFNLTRNSNLLNKIHEYQDLFIDLHNNLMEAIIIKEGLLNNANIDFSNDDVIRIGKQVFVETKNLTNILILISQDFKIDEKHIKILLNVNEKLKKVALACRRDDFNPEWGMKVIEECKKQLLSSGKELMELQMLERDNLIESLNK